MYAAIVTREIGELEARLPFARFKAAVGDLAVCFRPETQDCVGGVDRLDQRRILASTPLEFRGRSGESVVKIVNGDVDATVFEPFLLQPRPERTELVVQICVIPLDH